MSAGLWRIASWNAVTIFCHSSSGVTTSARIERPNSASAFRRAAERRASLVRRVASSWAAADESAGFKSAVANCDDAESASS